MKAKDACAQRIRNLAKDKGWSINKLATTAGIPKQSLHTMLQSDRRNVGIVLLKQVCDGFDISLKYFFDDELFDNLEQEIE